jgi:hypothetical protein
MLYAEEKKSQTFSFLVTRWAGIEKPLASFAVPLTFEPRSPYLWPTALERSLRVAALLKALITDDHALESGHHIILSPPFVVGKFLLGCLDQ